MPIMPFCSNLEMNSSADEWKEELRHTSNQQGCLSGNVMSRKCERLFEVDLERMEFREVLSIYLTTIS